MKNKSLQIIINFVNRNTGVDIRDTGRKREIIYARSIYYKLAREHTGYSFHNIGVVLNKNHATVMHSINNIYSQAMLYSNECKETYNKFNGIVEDVIDENTTEQLKAKVKELEIELTGVVEYTPNEYNYRKLSDKNKKIYDERASAMLRMMNIKRVKEADKYEQIKCSA